MSGLQRKQANDARSDIENYPGRNLYCMQRPEGEDEAISGRGNDVKRADGAMIARNTAGIGHKGMEISSAYSMNEADARKAVTRLRTAGTTYAEIGTPGSLWRPEL